MTGNIYNNAGYGSLVTFSAIIVATIPKQNPTSDEIK
jgi:hypothetical protein